VPRALKLWASELRRSFTAAPPSTLLQARLISTLYCPPAAAGVAATKVLALAWSPEDPLLLASAGSDFFIRFWDTSGAGRAEFAVPVKLNEVIQLAWHPTSYVLALSTMSDHIVFVDARRSSVDARKAAVLGSENQSSELNEIAWMPSGTLIAAMASKNLTDGYEGSLRILRPREGFVGSELVTTLRGQMGQMVTVRFDRACAHFATVSKDGAVSLWRMADLNVLRVFDRLDSPATSLSFSPDGALLAIASEDDKQLDVVRVADGSRVRTLSVSPYKPTAVAWAPHAHTRAILAFVVNPSEAPAGGAEPPFAVRLLSAGPLVGGDAPR